eukprot:gnl/TRDRNA2_/TRDRNA2_39816_c0_seq1.p1 gnl/TRDRNA2_/TRDRNA2_39816_c0~~gnl/TRDRNA2_/TRDRNA2_39816_c0_seq1.p1  ORF type:complete len:437 (-),score=59.18 gnl/TRDRNA2_/TRDRNA2_39816_c0_seq1:3-1313(-)
MRSPPVDPTLVVKASIVKLGGEVVKELVVHRSETAASVKERIHKALGLPASEQRLVVGAEVFDGPSRIQDLEDFAGDFSLLKITLVQVKPASRVALSGSQDGSMRLWDLESSSTIRPLMGGENAATCGAVRCIAIDWAERRAVSGNDDGFLRFWDLQCCQCVQELHAHSGPLLCLAASWSANRLLTGGEDGTLRLWHLQSGKADKEFAGHSGAIRCVASDCVMRYSISGGDDCCLRVWDLESSERDCLMEILGHVTPVNCLAVNFTSWKAVSGSSGVFKLWNLMSSSPEHVRENSAGNGRRALSGMCPELGRWIRVPYSPDQGGSTAGVPAYSIQKEFQGHTGNVLSIAVGHWDAFLCLSGGADGVVRLWTPVGDRNLNDGGCGPVNCLAVDWAGKTAISGNADGTLRLWDLIRGEAIGVLGALRGPPVMCVALGK